jgi:amino acid permease
LELDPDRELKPKIKYIFILLLLAGEVMLTILIPGIKIVFSLLGATVGNLVAFILPGSFYLKIIYKREKSKLPYNNNRFLKSFAWISIVFGLISLIIGLLANFLKIFE